MLYIKHYKNLTVQTHRRKETVRMRDGSVKYPLLARLEGWVFFLWVWVWRGCASGGVCLFVFLDHSLYSLFLLSLSLSLSLFGCLEFENHLKVKEKCKWFSESKGLFYSQSLRFSKKLYFTCAPRHTARCKIFSGNHLHPKQT